MIGFISELQLALCWVQRVKRKALENLLNASEDEMETMCGVKINMEAEKGLNDTNY